MKKIRVTILKYMDDILKYDAIEFGVSKNYLLNYIIFNFDLLRSEEVLTLIGKKEIIQFNLNKLNEDFYEELFIKSKFKTEASFMRKIIYGYISKSKVIRERFVLKKMIEKIENGINLKRKIKVKFLKGEKIVTPYDILYSSMEVSNYLFCYLEEENKYKNYRLTNIKYIYVVEENGFLGDSEYLKKVRLDFDPFLSYDFLVTIKLSEIGKKKFHMTKTNRPKLIKKLDDIWIVEASDEKIKRYFSYFMSDVEIIKPVELKNWFRNEVKKMVELYR